MLTKAQFEVLKALNWVFFVYHSCIKVKLEYLLYTREGRFLKNYRKD